jgi:hypothetical protein
LNWLSGSLWSRYMIVRYISAERRVRRFKNSLGDWSARLFPVFPVRCDYWTNGFKPGHYATWHRGPSKHGFLHRIATQIFFSGGEQGRSRVSWFGFAEQRFQCQIVVFSIKAHRVPLGSSESPDRVHSSSLGHRVAYTRSQVFGSDHRLGLYAPGNRYGARPSEFTVDLPPAHPGY